MNPKQRDSLLAHLDQWEKTRIRLELEHGGEANFYKNNEEEKLQEMTEDEIKILNENGDPSDYLLIEDPSWAMAPNGLAFGVVPRDIMQGTEIHNHLGTRVIALREIERILEEQGFVDIQTMRKQGEYQNADNSKATENFLNYGSLFLRFLSILVEDPAQEILFGIFKILKRILAIPGFGNKANFQHILLAIVKHVFKHKNINVRSEAQVVVHDIMLTMKSKTFLSTLAQ